MDGAPIIFSIVAEHTTFETLGLRQEIYEDTLSVSYVLSHYDPTP